MKCKIALVRDGSAEPGSRSIDEDAARWSEILRERDDATMREAFQAWQAQSPGHAEAYARAEAARRLADLLADEPEMQSLRSETLGRVARQGQARRASRRNWAMAASLTVAGLLGALGLNLGDSWRMVGDARDALAGNVYRTGVGQRERFTLADGSVITLNTDSRVSTHYRDGLRAVTLERGQALFKVAKDRSRPFVVSAGGRQVTALGTEFDVYLSPRAFEVTLLEGRVTVTRTVKPAAVASARPTAAATAPLAELRPGEQFVALAKAAPQVRAADVRRVVSWRNGQIVFENERLGDAVAEINRYSQRKIVLADATLASLKISGAFNTGDTGTFVEALTDYFPIERDTLDNDDIVLKPRAPLRG
ncbi:sigma factor regulatory protein, FecR/PupR family [Lysobacter enzymogenes]|uniref:Sigma factor regulatory protein, FecR/PupR family n=1 Tax=Lysobacter enzymogenes TaxID=69 RepID=A0A0S2DBQ7_LYSEN|nr:FecR domain-containing protein [Lysobacter enzymogenes]ALN55959.1 sigma factor regulatory protein, FecR/PupR family [Lysobacter enzymogenes]